MPVRYHAALRGSCQKCHDEHGKVPAEADYHRVLETDVRERCRACHHGTPVPDHARTDAVNSSLCHQLDRWQPAEARHDLVSKQPCDLCHRPPNNEAHENVNGACIDCHRTSSWMPKR